MTLTLAADHAEAARARELAGARRRATALLAALFVVITGGGGDATWAGYVQAAAEASLLDDPTLTARLQESIEAGARYVVEHLAGEIAGLVQGTIERWDGEETSRRLELLLDPDLQYIRMSGTVVGGAAGLGLHTVGQALG